MAARLPTRLVIGTLAVPLLLYFVVRTTAAALNPAAAAVLPPADASTALRVLVPMAADPRQRVTEEVRSMAHAGAEDSPLAWEPFFIEAKVHEQAGRLPQAIAVMEEAKRRRPTSVLIRVHLISYYQQAQRLPELLNEIDYVLRKSPEASEVIFPELLRLMRDPAGRVALARLFARNPGWRSEFFKSARARPGRAGDALALLNLIRSVRPGSDIRLEQGLYLHRLIQDGNYAAAREIWLQMLPQQQRQEDILVSNGAFSRQPAESPFDWTLPNQPSGRAELVSTGADISYLDALYYGGNNAVLAEQTLALAPGTYRMTHLVRSTTGLTSGEVAWQISCLPGNRLLARQPLQGLAAAYRRWGWSFAVPAECTGQQLKLVGTPGDISAEINVQIARLEIRRGD